MNFDLGNILTRSWQIPWKHKSIWGLLALPMVVGFFPFLLFFIFFLAVMGIVEWNVPDLMYFGFALIFLLIMVISTLVNYVVRTASISAATLGIVRAERGEGSTRFMDLLRDGLPYFWRILGVMTVVNLTVGLVFAIFFMLALLLIIVTIGMASICLQPIFILLAPLTFLMVAVIDAAEIAVIVDDMNVMDAVKHAVQVVRTHVWKYAIITTIVYFGSSILTSILIMPLMLPAFIVPSLIGFGQDISVQSVALLTLFFFGVFFPVMMLVSSVLGVYMKTSLDITYLRLTSPAENIKNQV